MTVPTGFKVLTKTKSVKKANKCKTKKTVKYKCGPKNSKTCTKRVCQKGFDTVKTKVPTGLQILYKKVDLCGAIRKVLGTKIANKFISSKKAICECFPKLRKMTTDGKFTSISSRGELTTANSKVLDEASTLQTCLHDASIYVSSSKETVLKKLGTSGATLATGEPIDDATYKAMIAAVAPCRGGSCSADLISTTFTKYLTKALDLMAKPLQDLLTKWESHLGFLQQLTQNLSFSCDDLANADESTAVVISASRGVLCDDLSWCSVESVSTFLIKTSIFQERVNQLWQARGPLDVPSTRVSDYQSQAAELKGHVKDIPSTGFMVSAIQSGDFETVKDIVKFMPITTDIPSLAEEVEGDVGVRLRDIIIEYKDSGELAEQEARELVETDFESEFPDDFRNAPFEVLDRLYLIQSVISEELLVALEVYNKGMKGLDERLKKSALTDGSFKSEVGTVAYERWSTFKMDLPCSKAVTTTYKKHGFSKTSSKYRKFSKCGYSSEKAQYAKRQVPYLRIRG
ncbi:hypothetical protein QQX98_005011 [Neonectria punicea]|uniref:Uncharacterized protein n=1 Tax=Neonectria punicea TaxID=979145 RepID=A0ABR1H6G3_9HYPO